MALNEISKTTAAAAFQGSFLQLIFCAYDLSQLCIHLALKFVLFEELHYKVNNFV